jgi:hypothetical protein
MLWMQAYRAARQLVQQTCLTYSRKEGRKQKNECVLHFVQLQ